MASLPDLIPGIIPPSRETYEWAIWIFQLFPIFTAIQWFTTFYPQGKTSIQSSLNLPGKYAWAIMELPGMLIVLYTLFSLPTHLNLLTLPWENYTMATLYTIHYLYRALLSPLYLNPSMSPIHLSVFLSAFAWQVLNGISLGGWLSGYGPTTTYDWAGHLYAIELGLVIWGWSFLLVLFHDDDLREIRRSALRRQKSQAEKDGKPIEGVEKLYMVPKNGLFNFILFPHYFCEWCEWAGFWVVGGWRCVPARNFLVNEVATMLPRAVQGRRWYVEKFGAERVGKRKAIIPGIL